MKDRTIHTICVFALFTLLCTAAYIGYASGNLYTLPEEKETVNHLDEYFNLVSESNTLVGESETQMFRTDEQEADIKPIEVIATAYCSCKKCCGAWAENRENGIVYTASGAIAKAGHTIAVDTSVIPFGSVVLIDGIEYVAEDTGSAIQGNRIDIYFDSHDEALQFGIQELTAYVK